MLVLLFKISKNFNYQIIWFIQTIMFSLQVMLIPERKYIKGRVSNLVKLSMYKQYNRINDSWLQYPPAKTRFYFDSL